MSNYIEYKSRVAFHPGYHVQEMVEFSGLTQEDFAKRLNTTPKNLSKLINGEQILSRDMALKLSRMLGMSVEFWLNCQKTYDMKLAEFESEIELEKEREIFSYIDYTYFKKNFGMPDLPRKKDEQIKAVREFLNIATLCVLKNRDLTIRFKSNSSEPTISNIINSNIMVEIAINKALKIEKRERYNKAKFIKAVDYVISLKDEQKELIPLITKMFSDAGVILVVLPNAPNSGIYGATKKLGDSILLMINERLVNSKDFWFTLFHEIGHVINGDFGITYQSDEGIKEYTADEFARELKNLQNKKKREQL